MSLLDIDNTNQITIDGLKSLGFIDQSPIFSSYYIKPVLNDYRLASFYYNTYSHSINVVTDNPFFHSIILKFKKELVGDIMDLAMYVNKVEEKFKEIMTFNFN